MLTRLEHFLLSSTMNDSEPLHILYKDALRKFKVVAFNSFIEALVKLFKLGYLETKIEDIGEFETELNKKRLLEHYHGGLSEKEINIYPDVTEYYFKVTSKGREEAEKDIYTVYYPE